MSHLGEGRDEAGNAHQARLGEQPGDLGHAADVLLAVRRREAQVLVEPVADVVPVQRVAGDGVSHQVLLQREADGGLAGARQAYIRVQRNRWRGRRGEEWKRRSSESFTIIPASPSRVHRREYDTWQCRGLVDRLGCTAGITLTSLT